MLAHAKFLVSSAKAEKHDFFAKKRDFSLGKRAFFMNNVFERKNTPEDLPRPQKINLVSAGAKGR